MAYRLLEIEEIGVKIATMAENALARHLKIAFSDYFSVDISTDVNVLRVFSLLGLCGRIPTIEQVIYKVRTLYPEFPVILAFTLSEIGRNWCISQNPICIDYYMNNLRPTPNKNSDVSLRIEL